MVQQVRSSCETLPANTLPAVPPLPINGNQGHPACKPGAPTPLLTVNVSGQPAAGNQAQFIPPDQVNLSFPPFLGDIGAHEVKVRRTVVFTSTPTSGGPPGTMHTIDGHKFDGNVGQVVLLNTAEEWKIENRTVDLADPPGLVDHPFHIHINPFQILEVFNPNEYVKNATNMLIPKYVFGPVQDAALQCSLDPQNPETWKDCHNVNQQGRVWWDVFPIPSGRVPMNANNQPITDPQGNPIVVPGYFKMRSRFVDFTGQYVIHCHILAHEDRGMMTVVEVVPFTTAYSHQ
jgi:FtsP/CotA-like multicopper oxidase with cupredoxin domain